MCDVSDGLVADLGHIAEASGVTIDIQLAPLRALGTEGVTDDQLLTGGDDHALAFTLPADRPLPAGAVVVGRVSPGPARVLVDGQPAPSGGWRHFSG
jgi:thiamine-monophosphate kinase